MAELIVHVAEMRDREERTWASGVSEISVIRRAGAALAQAAQRHTHTDDPVLVLAGRGHNGDDAAVAEQHLSDRDCTLLRFHDPAAFEAAHSWLAEHRGMRRAFIIDGLFGIGLNRPVEGEWRRLVDAINGSGIRVLSVDVPSGLNADTGEPQGAAIRAQVTVTLGAVKAGLVREQAAAYVGRLELAQDIGLIPGPTHGELWWTVAADFSGFPPVRADDEHKGNRGHVAVVAGSLGYHGAAVLAAGGALRARPGRVTVFTEERCYVPVASQLRSAMVRPWNGEALGHERFDAWVVGPGLASPGLRPTLREEVQRIWREESGVVVADASALDWLSRIPVADGAGPRVITPHPGEAGRLLEVSSEAIQADRVGAARRLAGKWAGTGVVAVLKGRHTVVVRGEGPVHLNSTGGPGLAQGGSGDVLAGYLGGLLAQPVLRRDVEHTVRYGVWRHGAAADALDLAEREWTVEELLGPLSVGTGR